MLYLADAFKCDVGMQIDDLDQFVILASDGLWDVVDDQQAVDIAAAELNAHAFATAATRSAEEPDTSVAPQELAANGPMSES